VDGSVISCTDAVVDPLLGSRNEPVGVHAEVGTLVDQELLFTNSVNDGKAACCVADMCRR
jgi:hypothetical protein